MASLPDSVNARGRSIKVALADIPTLRRTLHYCSFVGLLIEYLPEFAKWKHQTRSEKAALVAGVVLIAGGVFGEYLFGSWAGDAALKLQAQAEDAISKTTRQGALRDIAPEQINRLTTQLLPFADQPATIDIFPVNFENASLGLNIMAVLVGAKWQVPQVNYLPTPAIHSDANDVSFPGAPFIQAGVWVQATADEKSQTARRALVEALNSTEAKVNTSPSPLHGVAADRTEPRIWIYVGDKPTPIRSFLK